jgi:hypothetical protein
MPPCLPTLVPTKGGVKVNPSSCVWSIEILWSSGLCSNAYKSVIKYQNLFIRAAPTILGSDRILPKKLGSYE